MFNVAALLSTRSEEACSADRVFFLFFIDETGGIFLPGDLSSMLLHFYKKLSADELKKIVQEATKQLIKETNSKSAGILIREINSLSIRVKGFQNPLKAPEPILQRALLDASKYSPGLFAAIVRSWASRESELYAIVEKIMESIIKINKNAEQFSIEGQKIHLAFSLENNSTAELSDYNELEDVLRAELTNMGLENDVGIAQMGLLFWYALVNKIEQLVDMYCAAGDESNSAPEVALSDYPWKKCLEIIEGTQPTAPVWEEAENFWAAVQAVVDRKKAEQQAEQSIIMFKNKLMEFKKQYGEMLQRFEHVLPEVNQIASVDKENCPLAIKKLEELGQYFEQHREIENLPRSSIKIEQERRQRLYELEEKIQKIMQEINNNILPADIAVDNEIGSVSVDEPEQKKEPVIQTQDSFSSSSISIEQENVADESAGVWPIELHESESPVQGNVVMETEQTIKLDNHCEDLACDEVDKVDEVIEKQESIDTVVHQESIFTATDSSQDLEQRDDVEDGTGSGPEPTDGSIWLANRHERPIEQARHYIWSLLEQGRGGLAYRLAAFMERHDAEWSLPARLFTGVSLANHVRQDGSVIAEKLKKCLESFQRRHYEEQDGIVYNLLGASMAMFPALVIPGVSLPVLTEINFPAELSNLYQYCQTLINHNYGWTGIDFSSIKRIKDHASWEKEREEIAQEASDWYNNKARSATLKCILASRVWQYLLQPGKEIYRLLEPVRNMRTTYGDDYIKMINMLGRVDYVDSLIDHTTREVNRITTDKIQAAPRQQLHKQIKMARDFACRWLKINNTPGLSNYDYQARQLERLRQALASITPKARDELERYINGADPAARAATSQCIKAMDEC